MSLSDHSTVQEERKAAGAAPASQGASSNPLISALEGIRVVDFTQIAAGPLCTMLLVDMGADVIKIEPPPAISGDGPPFIGGEGAVFLALNRNKHGLVIDLKTEADVRPKRRSLQQMPWLKAFAPASLIAWASATEP
jgi:crotonobetainyl-CoA:carnitine CoA-transferase CaiB-like acyl-CoA transferase